MNIFLTTEQQSLYARVNNLAKEIPPGDQHSDAYAIALVRWLGKNKALDPLDDRRSFRLSSVALCLTRHALAYQSSLADSMFAMQGLGSFPIILAGNQKQRERLFDILTGRKVAAFALTEPEAGSDVVSMRTIARFDGANYLLNGSKSFISNAGIADHYILFAKTQPELGKKGISAFILDADAPGLAIKRQEVISPHPIGELILHNCPVPARNLLGVEGEGLRICLSTLDVFRPTVGAAALGFAERALDEALAYTNERVQFGQKLNEFQATQFRLAEMETQLTSAKLMVYQAAYNIDHHSDEVTRSSAMAKMYATETAQTIIDSALQLHGGRGVLKDSIMERLYRDIRALRIYEGTTEIQKLVIARDMMKKISTKDSSTKDGK